MPVTPSRFQPLPGVVGAALLIWGFAVGLLPLALLLCVLYEARSFTNVRWEPSDKDYLNIWHLIMVISLAVIVLNLVQGGVNQTFKVGFRWGPLLAFPLALAQAYALEPRMPLHTVTVFARHRREMDLKSGRRIRPPTFLNLAYPYVALILVCVGIGELPMGGLFILAAIFAAIALLHNLLLNSVKQTDRPMRLIWHPLLALIFALAIGGGALFGIAKFQHMLVNFTVKPRPPANRLGDATLNRTQIGDVKRIKVSRRIMWRLKVIEGGTPEYLRGRSYAYYNKGVWAENPLRMNTYEKIEEAEAVAGSWKLKPSETIQPNAEVVLAGWTRPELALLQLPTTAVQIDELFGEDLEQSQFHTTRIEGLNNLSKFSVRYNQDVLADIDPIIDLESVRSLNDVQVPIELEPLLDNILTKDLGVDIHGNHSPREILNKLGPYFETYEYTLDSGIESRDPIPAFLREVKKGHCEYFATATALLLRRVGIPARYCTGYSLQEYDPIHDEYLLRAKHRHAWCSVFIDGAWEYIDTTPPDWNTIEGEGNKRLQAIRDYFNRLRMSFGAWRGSPKGQAFIRWVFYIGIGSLILFAALRVLIGHGRGLGLRRKETEEKLRYPGEDSEFFELMAQLEERAGQTRPVHTPVPTWLREQRIEVDEATLQESYRLHQKYRFDPKGLRPDEREKLRESSRALLLSE